MTRRPTAASILCLAFAAALAFALCLALFASGAGGAEERAADKSPFKVRTVAGGLNNPWGLAFLPGGDALVGERDSGRILRVAPDGKTRLVRQVPEAGAGEGGLLGIATSPNSRRDRLVYVYYTTATDNRVARFRMGAGRALRPVLTGIPRGGIHNGGRIAFGPDRLLYVATGDAGDAPSSQNPGSLAGKVLRVTPEGRVPRDNPIRGSAVYSLGHRNVQGLAFDEDRRLFATELGSNRFDEVNVIRKGKNYGWPEVEGSGGAPRFVDPVVTFPTSEASPSGAAIPKNPQVRSWKGDLFVAALRGQRLYRIELNDRGRPTGQRQLLVGRYGRLRSVAEAPDGSLWVLTTNGGNADRILRLTRARG